MMDAFHLSFVRNRFEAVELSAVRYRAAGSADERISVRGKTSGAYVNAGTFQWTSAVQGVCAVMLTAVLHEKWNQCALPYIQGEHASLASSLDYALTKGPLWIAEMFGTTSLGTLRAKRLFRVSNPNRKRAGPVTISLNHNLLAVDDVRITLDGVLVQEPLTLLDMLQNLSRSEAQVVSQTKISAESGMSAVHMRDM